VTCRKKIVIVHNIVTPYKIALFNELSKLLQNLHVVFIAKSETRRDWQLDTSQIKFPHAILFDFPIDTLNNVKIARHTWQTLNSFNPEVLIICDYSNIFGWVAMKWGKKNKTDLIFWLDSTREDRKHYFPKEQIKHYFLKHFNLFLAPGLKTKQYLEYMKVDSSQIITTGYCVDNTYFIDQYERYFDQKQNLLPKLGIKTMKNFIFIGRFAKEKNILTLIDSFSRLKNNNWGLILLGDGPQKNEIQNYINKKQVKDSAYLPGFIQQKNIVKYFSIANVFILPSLSEPWGLVVNESMLCRLPVIVSTKCGCQPELVKEGVNGFSFNPHDSTELTKIMQRFIDGKHDLESMGTAGFKIISQHTPQNVAQKIVNGIQQFI